MTRRATIAALAGLLFLSGCVAVPRTTVLLNPEAKTRIKSYRAIAMVPIELEVNEVRLTEMPARLRDLEPGYEAELRALLEKRLQGMGWTLNSPKLDESALGQDNELRFRYAELKQASTLVSRRLYWRGGLPLAEARSIRAGIGGIANVFGARADADGLIFVRAAVVKKSEGMQAKDSFFTLLHALGGSYVRYPVAAAVVEFQFLDAASGEVLWSNVGIRSYFDKVDFEPLVVAMLKEFDLFHPKFGESSPPSSTQAP